MDRDCISPLVLVDLTAAFSTIDHGILLACLSGMGMGDTVVMLLPGK